TGHTEEAGYCLTAAVEKGNMRLVSSLFGTESDKSRHEQSKVLLKYGMRQFVTMQPRDKKIKRKIEVFEGKDDAIWLKPAKPIWITVPKGSERKVAFKLDYTSPQRAPITKGQVIGSIQAVLRTGDEDVVLQTVPMLAQQSVERASWFGRKTDALKLWWRSQ
ncbi:MAG TPA: D-alanyl-D-alanine carboxypeptidase, partial [Mariprofundaceae bacterium]|nr:D-alanyl-D-alanine carboxypeptidase [Mariprofundaceae bacterium]